jgi:hypothetical protein
MVLETKIRSHISNFSPYRAVNTSRLGYKNQSVNIVQGSSLFDRRSLQNIEMYFVGIMLNFFFCDKAAESKETTRAGRVIPY